MDPWYGVGQGLNQGLQAGLLVYNQAQDRQTRIQALTDQRQYQKDMLDLQKKKIAQEGQFGAAKLGIETDENGGLLPGLNDDGEESGYSYDTNSPAYKSMDIKNKESEAKIGLLGAQADFYKSGKGSGQKQDQQSNKDFLALNDRLDPNKSRAGNLQKLQATINAGDRIETLLNQFPDGNIPKVQSNEVATMVAGVLNGGSPQSQHQINSMVPETLRGDAAGIAEWLTNEPTGRGQQDFINMFHQTAQREGALAKRQLHVAQAANIPAFQYLFKKDPERYKGILRGRGFDPDTEIDEAGNYSGGMDINTQSPGGAVDSGSAGLTPLEAARLQHLRAKKAGK